MENTNLVLSVRRWNSESSIKLNKLDEKTMRTHSAVFKRDGNRCMFCGFKSNLLQEIHHKNGDHSDNDPSNLATICELCHMVQHIGNEGYFSDVTLIWLPEISQAKLNHLVRTILVAQRQIFLSHERGQSNKVTRYSILKDTLESLSERFRFRQDMAHSLFGTCEPIELGSALLSLSDSEYERREQILKDLKLLPYGLQTKTMNLAVMELVDAWTGKGGPYYRIPPETWIGILNRVMSPQTVS